MTSPEPGVLLHDITTASGHRFGHATLNVPATLNALSLDMIRLLAPAFDRWMADPQVAGVIIDGSGEKALCAGGDVAALVRAIRALPPGELTPLAAEFFEAEYRLDHRIHTAPKPVLCWGHGIVMGGGIGLMAGSSHRVATPKTRMAMPEITIGLYPDVGGSWFLGRLAGRAGPFLALTAAPLNAADARFAGLADFVLRHEDKTAVLAALAAASWSGDGAKDGSTLSHLLQGFEPGVEVPESPLRRHFDLIETVIGHDGLADIAPRLLALKDHADPWLATAAASFAKGSPTSAVLGLEMQRRAKPMALADVFRMEYDVSLGCCVHPDFPEGVRALLMDKDRNPKWRFTRFEDVAPAYLEEHFAARYAGAHPLADLH